MYPGESVSSVVCADRSELNPEPVAAHIKHQQGFHFLLSLAPTHSRPPCLVTHSRIIGRAVSEFGSAVDHRFDHGVQPGTSPPRLSMPIRFFAMYDSLSSSATIVFPVVNVAMTPWRNIIASHLPLYFQPPAGMRATSADPICSEALKRFCGSGSASNRSDQI